MFPGVRPILNDKVILISGGTGSFGRRCVKTVLERYRPRKLIILSRDEFKQYEMQQEFNAGCMRYFLGDVRDAGRMMLAMDGVDYVIHAAALKQVPMLEYNPDEAVKTNIQGTQNVIAAALEKGVSKLIMLSTDKAASPINLYGASKLVAEKLCVAANNIRGSRKTMFSVVRYGNVIGSRGSVVELFRRLAASGVREFPLTDPRMTRFWVTQQQGVDFALQCLAHAQGGETFIPKLPSMRVADLAKAIDPEAKLREIGIRPGEKLHEVLCPRELSSDTLEFQDHYVVMPAFLFTARPDYTVNAGGEKGRRVADMFEYNSLDNPHFLGTEELRALLAQV